MSTEGASKLLDRSPAPQASTLAAHQAALEATEISGPQVLRAVGVLCVCVGK